MTLMCDERNETGVDVSTSMAYEPTGSGTTATRTVTRTDNARSVMHTFVLAPIPCSTGGLNLAEPATVSFPAVTLDGHDKTTTTTAGFTVNDQTGTTSGWNLSATSTTFTNGARTLPTNATTITGITPSAGAGRCSAPTNSITYPVVLPRDHRPGRVQALQRRRRHRARPDRPCGLAEPRGPGAGPQRQLQLHVDTSRSRTGS